MKRTPFSLRVVGAALAVAAACAATAAAASSAPPNATARPSVSGAARDGSTITTSNGRWSNKPTSFGYSWLRCASDGATCALIAGANSKSYTITTADVGHRLRSEVSATNSSGSTSSTSNPTAVVLAAGTGPRNTGAPSISGNPQEGQTLAATNGTWSGAQPITYAYQWNRCDATGAGCVAITGATGQTYNATSADDAHTLRVTVKATNRVGTTAATSAATAVVAPAKPGEAAISVTTIDKPDQLLIDSVKFSPQPLGARRTLTGRFHVTDDRGFSVQGALVYAIGLPYGWTRNSPETTTDGSGWATITFTPSARLPLSRGTELVVFVRVRKPGDSVLGGVSSRRLVQAKIR